MNRLETLAPELTIKNAYDRFAVERFPLPSEPQIAELERQIGVRFPED